MRRQYEGVDDIILTIDGLQPEKGHETLYVVRELTQKRVWLGAIRKNRCLGAGFLFSTCPLIIVVFRHSRRKGNDHAQAQTQPTATSREGPTTTA